MAEERQEEAELISMRFHRRRQNVDGVGTDEAWKIRRVENSSSTETTSHSHLSHSQIFSSVAPSPKGQRNRELGLSPGLLPNTSGILSRKGSNLRQSDLNSRFLYDHLAKKNFWEPRDTPDHTHHGGAFGMDFTSDGSILAVACEHKSLLFFDPLNAKLVNSVAKAHEDCTNSIKFLDDRLFASCSDDNTVRIWDLRYLKSPVRTMRAHLNWVKNVEFIPSQGLILSSAFDGYVYAWDINDSIPEPRRLFYTPGLMRMRLTPDAQKMVLSTQWGYLLAIHDLDIDSLPKDLFGFKPNMYWLMIKCSQAFASSAEFVERFRANRNRTEIILDFPEGCDPENVSSICPHPQSWCIASRSNNHDEKSEWTCIHDLQNPAMDEFEEKATGAADWSESPATSGNFPPIGSGSPSTPTAAVLLADEGEGPGGASMTTSFVENENSVVTSATIRLDAPRHRRRHHPGPEHIITLNLEGDQGGSEAPADPYWSTSSSSTNSSSSDWSDEEESDVRWMRIQDMRLRRQRRRGVRVQSEPGGQLGDEPERRNSDGGTGTERARVRQQRVARGRRRVVRARRRRRQGVHLNLHSQQVSADIRVSSSNWTREPRAFFLRTGPPNSGNRTIVVLGGTSSPPLVQEPPESFAQGQRAVTIPRTHSRLICYQEEPRVGRGFIKEQAWSADGRILASPYAFGVRLLGFSENCQELSDIMPLKKSVMPREMSEIKIGVEHSNVVLCAKFSPTHNLLATGCLSGKIVFMQPIF